MWYKALLRIQKPLYVIRYTLSLILLSAFLFAIGWIIYRELIDITPELVWTLIIILAVGGVSISYCMIKHFINNRKIVFQYWDEQIEAQKQK